MPMRIVRRSYTFVRVDAVSVLMVPLVATVVMVAAGKAAIASGLVVSFYASPFVMLSALVSNRVCLRAGVLAAAIGVVAHEFFFSAPYYQLNLPTSEQALAYSFSFLAAYGCARRTTTRPPAEKPQEASSKLPFTADDTTHERRFWVVDATDDWAEDCTVGAEYARIYLSRLRLKIPAPPLGWIVQDMIKGGRYTGVEAGFLSSMTKAAANETILEHRRLLSDQDTNDLNDDTSVIKS